MHRLALLLLILGLGQTIYAASIFEFPDLTRRIPARSSTPGCAYKGERYTHGEQVETAEPCLNCTCIRAVVVCYLRVCPSPPAPPAGCFLAREVGQCCPTLVCGGDEKPKPSNEETALPDLRPTFQPAQPDTTTVQPEQPDTTTVPPEQPETTTAQPTQPKTSTITTTEENSLIYVTSDEIDDDAPFSNDIPGGCLVNGTLYGDGSAMLSSSFCEYCFCIRGKSTCLKPKCDLAIEGCTPHYDSHFSCCPSRYDCYKNTSTEETSAMSTTIGTTRPSDDYGDCITDGQVYHQGDAVPDYQSCHSCYCSNSSIICDKIKCSPPLTGCHPIIPEGHCCPVSYKCDYHGNVDNYNIKVKSSNGSKFEAESKKSEIKTVKQSDNFKNSPSNIDSKLKSPSINKEETTYLHNFLPVNRRLDEDISHLYIYPDSDLQSSEKPSEVHLQIGIGQKPTAHPRENHKTLNLEGIQLQAETVPLYTTTIGENIKNVIVTSSESKLDQNENLNTVSTGAPDERTLTIEELVEQFFSSNNEHSLEPTTKLFLEPKRNNSKQPSSIIDILNTTTHPIHHNISSEMKKTNITVNQPHIKKIQSTTPMPQNTAIFYESTSGTSSNIKKDEKSHSTKLYTTLYYQENRETKHDNEYTPFTTYIPVNPTTYSPRQDTQTWHITESTTNSEASEDTTKEQAVIKNNTEHTRINSKHPSTSYSENKTQDYLSNPHDPLLEESLVKFYLPAEGRDSDTDDDFTNVGAIHLGAPLSVEATEIRKDPINLRNKITESGGVIFMDPEYTDINPNLPSTRNKPQPTAINPTSDISSRNTEFAPAIERSDNYFNYDRKKGPRIQDIYNQTNPGQDFKIIPFVAEDAIRGKFGKVNNTFHVLTDTTEGVPDMVSDFCFIKGRIYMNGEMITKPDPCELCRCFYGQELCQLQRCPTPPPDCVPEKLPAFCCPRFTCGNNSTFKEHSPPAQKITINTQDNSPFMRPSIKHEIPEISKSKNQRPEDIKFGTRVRPRPTPITKPKATTYFPEITQKSEQFPAVITRKSDIIRTSAFQTQENTWTTTSRTPELMKDSTSKIFNHNRISTTKQPDVVFTTKKIQNVPFSDPWGLLKVSGCNIYGKFFNINDQVEILSGPCSHCICTVNGVECNDIC